MLRPQPRLGVLKKFLNVQKIKLVSFLSHIKTHTHAVMESSLEQSESSDSSSDESVQEDLVMSKLEDEESRADKAMFFDSNKLMLTYSGHVNKKRLRRYIEEVTKREYVFYRCAHEESDKNHPYRHTHVLVQWKTAYRSRQSDVFDLAMDSNILDKKFDYKGLAKKSGKPKKVVHPHFGFIKTASHFNNCKGYLSKEDPDNADLAECKETTKEHWTEPLKACKTRAQVTKLCQKPGDVLGKMTAYDAIMAESKAEKRDIAELRRWQVKLHQRCEMANNYVHPKNTMPDLPEEEWGDDVPIPGDVKNPFDRIIQVLYDPVGCAGKTTAAKILCGACPDRYYMVQGVPQPRDLATILIQATMTSEWQGGTIIFNLTRQQYDHKIYSSLEACIDGVMTAVKYQGGTKIFSLRNVVVFTNFMLNPRAVTSDRWEVTLLTSRQCAGKRISYKKMCKVYDKERQKLMDKSQEDSD